MAPRRRLRLLLRSSSSLRVVSGVARSSLPSLPSSGKAKAGLSLKKRLNLRLRFLPPRAKLSLENRLTSLAKSAVSDEGAATGAGELSGGAWSAEGRGDRRTSVGEACGLPPVLLPVPTRAISDPTEAVRSSCCGTCHLRRVTFLCAAAASSLVSGEDRPSPSLIRFCVDDELGRPVEGDLAIFAFFPFCRHCSVSLSTSFPSLP
mmetsp:Transcript_711/g.1489  ORF Transcript_711/g.1489 Transcript_711/m.1489 type:complete len:205 (-) Transcript_711:206-820(-)